MRECLERALSATLNAGLREQRRRSKARRSVSGLSHSSPRLPGGKVQISSTYKSAVATENSTRLARRTVSFTIVVLVGTKPWTNKTVAGLNKPIEFCRDVLGRTGVLRDVTDDNMWSEWRHFLALEG